MNRAVVLIPGRPDQFERLVDNVDSLDSGNASCAIDGGIMKVVALVSGGKDSCYNMQLCQSYGHEIVALANLLPLHDTVDELDSFMYQTVGHQVVAAFAQCMGLPLFRRRIQGTPRAMDLRYSMTEGDEVEDLEVLLKAVKNQIPGLGGVSTGAIASDYQRLRVENVCSRLGLVSLAYMWRQEQAFLLQDMIDSGLQAILVKVAAMGLDPHKHLGRDLTTLQPLFLKLQDLYGCNVCGEGGEYESLTLDCPLFKNAKIVLDEFTVQLHSPDTIAPVGVLHPVKFHLEYKSVDPDLTLTELLHEVTNDFYCTQDNKSDTTPGLSEGSWNCTGYIPNQEASIQCEFLTKVNRQKHGSVAISCWRHGLPLEEVQRELGLLLGEVERKLRIEELCWADVLYVHLYLNDMKEFFTVNQTYMQHVTEKDSVRGVPSRCCVEIPLSQAGMGHVMIEIVAVANCSKKVLHVQSISSWAPCCIGPYSQVLSLNSGVCMQATQHQQLIYMAGQLGLDPPTMNLVQGGAGCEMAQALKNCEAVAEVFISMFLDSVLSFTVYCSSAAGVKGMHDVGAVFDKYLSSGKSAVTSSKDHMVPKPLVLYILLPGLPKGALVEVAPLTYKCESLPNIYSDPAEDTDPTSWQLISKQSFRSGPSGVQEFSSCKGLVLKGYLCRALIFISSLIVVEEESNSQISFDEQVALKQAFQLLANILAQAALGWADVFVLRVYFVVEKINANDLRNALGVVLENFISASVPQPTLIPVLGVGETVELQDLIAVELTASGGMT